MKKISKVMASSPESTFTQYLLRKLPKEIYSWKIMNSMQNGVPDTYISGMDGDLWAEMKWVKPPKRNTTIIDPGLSELQKRWLVGRYREGRNVAVVIGSTIGCCILRKTRLLNTITKSDLTMSKQDVVRWIINQTQE